MKPASYKAVYGGRGSGKSHEFAGLMIDECMMYPGLRCVCIREIQHSLQESSKRLLEDKIKTYGLTREFQILNNEIRTPGDGIIIFMGMQNHTADSIKSLEKYDRGWVDEAQNLSAHSLKLLLPTFRQDPIGVPGQSDYRPGSEIWFSWNPRDPKDAVDAMFRGAKRPPNSIVVRANWQDNPWFPNVLRSTMEWSRSTDLDAYAHIWMGGYEKHSNARVFNNWRVEEFTAPENTIFHLGADWGFSNDPSTLVRCFESTKNWKTGEPWPRKRIYVDRDILRIGVEIDHLPQFFDGLVCGCKLPEGGRPADPCEHKELHAWARPWSIVADSARPETISYLRRHGYSRMEAAKKGANSVKEGVIFLQGYQIIVHPRAQNAQDELSSYSYVVDDNTGLPTPVLADKKNHIIDPMRYALEQLRGQIRVHEARWG